MPATDIHFVTGSNRKFTEAIPILPDLKLFLPPEDLVEIQSLNPKEVIEAKLKEVRSKYSKQCPGGVIVEDTSLVFASLGDLPGTFIKHFRSSLGLDRLANLGTSLGDTKAVARTYLGYSDPKGNILFVKGEVRGNIVSPPRGQDFPNGWGPIFQPEGTPKTFGEMVDPAKKSVFSMRARAFMELKARI